MYIQGWSKAAAYIGVTTRTLKRWHYDYIRIPFVRDADHKYAKLRIHISLLDLWYQRVREMRAELKRSE